MPASTRNWHGPRRIKGPTVLPPSPGFSGRRSGEFALLLDFVESELGQKLPEVGGEFRGSILVPDKTRAELFGDRSIWVERRKVLGALGGVVRTKSPSMTPGEFPFEAILPVRPWRGSEAFWATAARMVLEVVGRPSDSPWPINETTQDLVGKPWWNSLLHRREWGLAQLVEPGRYVPLLRKQGVTYADPFSVTHGGDEWVFFEEQPRGNRGFLSAGRLAQGGLVDLVNNVLPCQTHRSWPNVFWHQGDLWMLPESGEDCEVALWRCTQFPNQWEKERVLLSGQDWRDPVLFEHEDLWWLFVSRSGPSSGSHSDSAHLFFSQNPWSQPFSPHPWNPVAVGVVGSRPAGRIFLTDQGWIRPTQDGSGHYGRGIVLRKIVELNKTRFVEQTVQRILPPKGSVGIHTWNMTDSVVLVDLLGSVSRFA